MFYLFIFFFILFILYIYKKIWNFLKKDNVPTGAGIIFTFVVIILIFFQQSLYTSNYHINYFFLFILTLIYFIDDLYNLSVVIRILLQMTMGLSIAYFFFYGLDYFDFFTFIIVALVLITASLLLTNTINFYDGADLNITVFAFLNLVVLLIVFDLNYEKINLIIISLIFFLVFALFNYKENNLYFGDAGSFFFAGLLIIFICSALIDGNPKIIYLLTTLTLPILDVLYVISYRFYLGESLHTRHFYQIYQIAREKQRNHMYLLIQPINTVLVVLTIFILIRLGMSETYSVILSSTFITIIYYFLLRHYLLRAMIKR
tara:strand:- start:3363 stop:4313 length:951 start_codon:yes stop_codon:yes gene_type:complete